MKKQHLTTHSEISKIKPKSRIEAKRCSECDKIIHQNNKSGLCTFHYRKLYYGGKIK
jgi:hypothetical protein